MLKEITVGDIVKPTGDDWQEYRVVKTLKTVCWIRLLPKQSNRGISQVYKNVRYSHVEKLR